MARLRHRRLDDLDRLVHSTKGQSPSALRTLAKSYLDCNSSDQAIPLLQKLSELLPKDKNVRKDDSSNCATISWANDICIFTP
jgi:hypothetical protein